ncbi:minor tail protein [Gordonia phage Evaa]|nr:minor tail protein [Gordonia phage Evaa]
MIITPNQTVSLHTYDGIQLAQFAPARQSSMLWSRNLRDVSRCELVVPVSPDLALIDVTPWLHWVSVWDSDANTLLWGGPVQKVQTTRTALTLSCRDVSALASRTRVPITKQWDTTDPSRIAAELWRAMIELHNLNLAPIVRVDPEGDFFDFETTADTKMLNTTIDDLVKVGLSWCVVAGTPILGPVPKEPVAALGEGDFMGELEVTRDGSATFNDVLLRGADFSSRTRVALGGLNLQTIVNVDDLFGVSNVGRAARQYARHSAGITDILTVPGGTALRPDAPVSIDELLPGARFVVEAYGLRVLMELESVEVNLDAGDVQVAVTLDSVNELPELAEISGGGMGDLGL